MFTRESTLLFLTAMVIGGLLITAFQPAAQPSGTEEPSTSPTAEKSITIVIAEDPPSFNPMVADTGYDALIMELVMLGMTDVDPQGNVLPELAAELPTPSWDNLISTAQDHFIKHPWLAIFPGLMIFITIISVNYIGDGLRHAFDSYKVLETVGEYT